MRAQISFRGYEASTTHLQVALPSEIMNDLYESFFFLNLTTSTMQLSFFPYQTFSILGMAFSVSCSIRSNENALNYCQMKILKSWLIQKHTVPYQLILCFQDQPFILELLMHFYQIYYKSFSSMPLFRRIILTILILGILLISVTAIKPTHEQSGTEALRIINSMLRSNNLPETKQIGHCLAPEEANGILAVITKLTNVAADAGTTQLKNFPAYYLNYTQTFFSNATLSCIYKSRDFKLLLQNYGTDLDQMGVVFTKTVDKSYLIVHKSFTELKNKLLQGLYEDYGVRLDLMFKDYFGMVVKKEKEWVKSVSNLQNFDSKEYFGITVSNGVIGAVSSIRPISVATTVLGGAYDVFGRGRVDNIVETFPALQVEINVGGSDITGGGYYNYEQGLNFRSGQFIGEYSHERCSVKYSYVALKNLPFAFYTSVEIVAHETTTLSAVLRHKAPEYLNDIQKSYENLAGLGIIHTKATTKTGKLDLVIASSFTKQEGTEYTFSHEDWDSNNHLLKTSIIITKGQVYKLGFITSLISTAHHEDPVNEAIRIVERGVLVGQQTLIAAHRALWEKLWVNDIVIEGHDEDQKNVRLMLYHCYAFINDFKSYGISPMGLSGLGYNGHVFWDMDLWIYPGILGLNPSLAKTLIEYRVERLEAARNNAFINGYQGAMFPWESSKLGIEETPVWALSGPLQHHISGCVAFAVWNYFSVTQDKHWLEEKGLPLLAAVAQFWTSRVVKADDGYHINNVVAADQWAENVDDNAFTNAVAKQSLRLYNVAAKRLNLPQNKKYTEISEGIVILKLQNNVTKEHSRYHGQNIKQADVNLLAYPLKLITDIQQIKRDLVYYQERIPDQGTPAMTYSIFTILYSRLMDSDSAYKFFKQSHQNYLKQPFNAFAETKWGNNPYFLTGAGGVIQSLVFGFGGYDITDNGIQRIKTAIPKEWKSVTIKGFLNDHLAQTPIV